MEGRGRKRGNGGYREKRKGKWRGEGKHTIAKNFKKLSIKWYSGYFFELCLSC